MEGRGEEGRNGREGEEIGICGGWSRPVWGLESGVAASSNSGTVPSPPRNPWMNACRDRREMQPLISLLKTTTP